MFTRPKLSLDGVEGGGDLSGPERPKETGFLQVPELAKVEHKALGQRMLFALVAEHKALGQRMLFALVGDELLYDQACKEQWDKGEEYLRSVIGKHRSDANDSTECANWGAIFEAAGRSSRPDQVRTQKLDMANQLERLIEQHQQHLPNMSQDLANLASDSPKTTCFIPMSNQGGGFSILHNISDPIKTPADLVNSLAQSVLADLASLQGPRFLLIDLNNFPQYQALLGISEAVRQHSIDLGIPDTDSAGFLQTTLSRIGQAASSRPASGRGKV